MRRKEAESVAKAIDLSDNRFFDLGDYPLEFAPGSRAKIVDIIRECQPGFMMSHSQNDPHNTDHMRATEMVLEAPQLYLFEPHQTNQMGWVPNVLLDISEVWKLKRAAIECMEGQQHLWEYYTNVANNRANHFRRISGGQSGGHPAQYAEAFQVVFPVCVDELL